MYAVRPVTLTGPSGAVPANNDIDERLARFSRYGHKAILTESLYMRYGSSWEKFHDNQGTTTAYGDGHVKFVWDRTGARFLNRLRVQRGNSTYYIDDPADGEDGDLQGGVWYDLDMAF